VKRVFSKLSLALVAMSLCALVALALLVALRDADNDAREKHRGQSIERNDLSDQPPSQISEESLASEQQGHAGDAHRPLSPGDVLDNPDCRIVSSGQRTALLMVPNADGGARYSTVDSDGVLHSGELDFWPRTIDIAERSDGAVLTAFGDIEREEPGRPAPDARYPVRIYLNGMPLIEHENIWQFELAGDGSSYFLVEPLAGDTSRLVIHNFDEGNERVHDIGDMLTPLDSGGLVHVPGYTRDYSEVHLYPNYDGVGRHFFYPVGGERREPVRVLVPEENEAEGMIAHAAVFPSSKVGYVSYYLRGAEDIFQVHKVELDAHGSGTGAEITWGRTLHRTDAAPDSMTLSPNGRLLMLDGRGIVLIDTDSGQFVFKWPLGDNQAQLARLRSVLGPDAGVKDMGAVMGSIELTDDRLYLGRSRRLENNYFERFAIDVFELDGIKLDSGPIRRDPYPPRSEAPPCSPEALFGRLGERDGQLVFE